MTDKETYLGDGLYASIDSGMIKLRAPQYDGSDQTVYLEVEVLDAFLVWLKDIRRTLLASGNPQ